MFTFNKLDCTLRGQFMIEAEADGVQDHNARAAIKSAWGLTDEDISRLGLNIDETR